jgi:hypothetical protein
MDCLKSQNQCINAILFPGRFNQSSYNINTFQDLHNLTLLYVPFKRKKCTSFGYLDAAPDFIPVLLSINPSKNTQFFAIHFHGNACDVGQISICASRESAAYNSHYMIVEYPGFGISNGYPNELVMDEIAKIVYDFVVHDLQINYQQVVIIGRSIGTGPACSLTGYLHSIGMPPFALVLHSPFSSIADVTSDLLGSCISCFLLNRWENHYYLVNSKKNPFTIQIPVLFLHADNDRIIHILHSQLLHDERKKLNLPSEFFIQKSDNVYIKGHNYFDYEKDVVQPTKKFLYQLYQEREEKIRMMEKNPMEYEQQQQQQQPGASSTTSSSSTKLSRFVPLIIPKAMIRQHSTVPDVYNPELPSSAFVTNSSKQQLWNQNVYYEKKKNPWTFYDILGWSCCPCLFTAECCCAINWNGMKICYYCVMQEKPNFNYQSLKPANVQQGSLMQVLFRNKTFMKNINEEASAKSHTEAISTSSSNSSSKKGVIEDTSYKSAKRRSMGRNDVENPMISNARSTGEIDSSTKKPASSSASSANEDNPAAGGTIAVVAITSSSDGSTTPPGAVHRVRPTRSKSSMVGPASLAIPKNGSSAEDITVTRSATDKERQEEEMKRSVNSPSEAKHGQHPAEHHPSSLPVLELDDIVVNPSEEDSNSETQLTYVPG